MKPIICITTGIDQEGTMSLLAPYVHAIEEVGGVPLLLPFTKSDQTLTHICEITDGFFFSGGADIDPAHYGETIKETCGSVQSNRDTVEFALFSRAYATGKPILGICRGMQLINVALGGTLYQDVPSERPSHIAHLQREPKFSHSHDVQIQANTPLHALIGKDRMGANSFHHQALKTLGTDLAVMARADDGMIEAVYSTRERYLRAYQWHPERLIAMSEQNRMLFADFIVACSENNT